MRVCTDAYAPSGAQLCVGAYVPAYAVGQKPYKIMNIFAFNNTMSALGMG